MKKLVAWCPSCGPLFGTDEDGCCVTCGCTAVGDGAAKALRLLAKSGRAVDAVVKAALAMYRGRNLMSELNAMDRAVERLLKSRKK